MGRDSRINPFGGPRRAPGLVNAGGVPIIGETLVLEIKDARGRTLREGDEIILQTPTLPGFRVLRVARQAGDPPGLVRVELASFMSFLATPAEASLEFLRVRTAEEAGALPIKLRDDDGPQPPAPGVSA